MPFKETDYYKGATRTYYLKPNQEQRFIMETYDPMDGKQPNSWKNKVSIKILDENKISITYLGENPTEEVLTAKEFKVKLFQENNEFYLQRSLPTRVHDLLRGSGVYKFSKIEWEENNIVTKARVSK